MNKEEREEARYAHSLSVGSVSVTETGVQVVTDNVGSMFLDRRHYEPGCTLWEFLVSVSERVVGDWKTLPCLKDKSLVWVDTYGFQTQWSYR